jgi:tetratricopeptide (TPR) repeat protein
MRRAATALLATALASCSSGPGDPTFARDVGPLVRRHCIACHKVGGGAPFPLVTYEDVARRSGGLARATASGYMPPWLPEPNPHGFVGERRLGEEEVATFARWHELGAPAGDLARLAPLAPEELATGWRLGAPDLVLELEEPFELAPEGRDAFRNFVLPVRVPATRHVRAFELLPEPAAAIHHAILALDRAGDCRRLDAAARGPGFPGMSMGSAQPPDGHFLGWTPGKSPQETPAGMAWRLEPGDELVLQLHMIRSGKPELVRPRIGLFFTDEPPTRFPHTLTLYSEEIDIPAGARGQRVVDEARLPVDVHALAVYPHAHYLGETLRGTARLPDGSELELIRIDAWAFDQQDEYVYRDAVALPAGTVLRMEWTYDNSADNVRNPNDPPARVRFGDRSEDEMGTLSYVLVPDDARDLNALRASRWQHALAKNPGDWHALNQLAVEAAGVGRREEAAELLRQALRLRPDFADARTNLGLIRLNQGDPALALPHLTRALADAPDHVAAAAHLARAQAELGRTREALATYEGLLARRPALNDVRARYATLLAASDEPARAIAEFERILQTVPGSAELHNNLANALFATERFDRSAEHYRRALALRPDHFNAAYNLGRVLAAAGRTDDAVEALRAAERLRPGDPRVQAELRALGR